jgi:murein DD-endopeptidase MepM/ murein hydrolase activator NlpD
MKQILNKLTSAGICVILFGTPLIEINAQNTTENTTDTEEVKKVTEEPKLIADKATIKNELIAIDSVMMILELGEEEEGLSPADELYDGEWNNEYVKAYANITIPDSFKIDLSSFVMPIAGRVTSSYGPRRRRFHYGTDVKLQVGDTIVAAFDGKIRVKKYERRGYGYYLVLRHPNGLETVYGHLSKFLVEEDETVKAGQPIALGGNTGRSTGAHLHFECRFLGLAIDPSLIVDFENFCTFDDNYVFQKSKTGKEYYKNKNNKYLATGNTQVKYHRVRQGDSLSIIAQKYRVTVDQLCRLNGIKRTTTLKVGRSLRYS